MPTKKVDISKAKTEYLNLISDAEAYDIIHKGWSLSFVYSFRELRDVFLAFQKYGQKNISVMEFSNRYVKDRIPYEKKPWDEKGRRVLEIKNALINFGLMDKDSLECKQGVFEVVETGTPLVESDLLVFRDIFFHYFRFLEYASLFISPSMSRREKLALTEKQVLQESHALFYYGSAGGRVDTFFYDLKNPETVFKFPKSEEKGTVKGGFMRFWDVFISWAKQLDLIARLNMKSQDITLSKGETFRACYFINPACKVDVQQVLDEKFKRQLLIDISLLVMELCLSFRCSIEDAQQEVINYYHSHPYNVSIIRTSEIFIKTRELNERDRNLYPIYKGSYVSHIKLRSYE